MSGEYSGSTFELLTRIEAKAFRYLLTGEELYGYQAIYNIRNAILTAEHIEIDPYRAYGLTMYVAACVYDWCYPLLTDSDKEQILRGCINLLGKRMEVGCPPAKEGAIAHHTVECQILRSYLSLGIAVYDEHPEIYEFVAGRLYNDIVPAQNFMLASEKHWEGAYYAPFRYCNLLDAQFLISAMTDGRVEMFNAKSLHAVANTFMDFTLPGLTYDKIHVFEMGDVAASSFEDYFSSCFFSSCMFGDAKLKGFSFKCYNDKTDFDKLMNNTYVSAVRYLILNDPDLAPEDPFDGRDLVKVTKYPGSAIFARGAWNDKNAPAVYMTMPEFYSASHSHAEAGSFQIYYKGMLASDSGYYSTHGIGHHAAYTRQTISSNSILVYNPGFIVEGGGRDHVYSGGQSLRQDITRIIAPYTLDSAMTCASMNQVKILGKGYGPSGGSYRYSYIAGDMTNAYDEETVDEVTRHMLSVMTDNEIYPMVFVTFDRITAKHAHFKKTVLLHSMTEPTVTDDGLVVITNTKDGNCGKLVAQTLLTDTSVSVFGDGNGAEYTIQSTIFKPVSYNPDDPDYRIEFSPKHPKKTDLIMNVMYVTDADNDSKLIKAQSIETDELVGASILGQVLLFNKNGKALTSEFSVRLPNADGVADCYVAGVAAGDWQIKCDEKSAYTCEVKEGEGILHFTSTGGDIKIIPV
jgi:heparin/heparan-sulfate lyase